MSRVAFYSKINGIEPQVSQALVRYSSEQLAPLVEELGGKQPEILPGYRIKIIDGNNLAATEHRLSVLRDVEGGPLPWTVEGLFQVVTDTLECEIKTLGYPKAALFSFCMALVAYNILSVIKAALRSVHGQGKIDAGISNYYLALGNSIKAKPVRHLTEQRQRAFVRRHSGRDLMICPMPLGNRAPNFSYEK